MEEVKKVNWLSLKRPKKLLYEKETFSDTYGKFIAEPFERGYGVTIGNSIRRILLSSLAGPAVTTLKIDKVLHEFSTIPNVVEDVPHLILNIKGLLFKLHSEEPQYVHIDAVGPCEVKGKDIKLTSNIEILNPDHHIATVGEGGRLKAELKVEFGRGYVPVEKIKEREHPIGVIPIDAVFSPVRKVNYYVENTRVGEITDYDRLIIEVWTTGSIRPDDAIAYASKILKDCLDIFTNFREETPETHREEAAVEEKLECRELLKEKVEKLDLSVRAYNCLKNAGIETIGDLVRKTEAEMLKYKNFGRKSLDELKEVISKVGLSFGMDVDAILSQEEEPR
jgi:DNA-directed RNA polymerase subunit alpha